MRALVVAVVLSLPLLAHAAGFDYPDHGTAALSRGGTFTARADDPTALLYNPAGAALLRGTHVLINGNILDENIRFQRRNYPAPNDPAKLTLIPDRYHNDQSLRMPEVRNDDAPFITPFIAVTTDLGLSFFKRHRLTLMAGVYGPHVHPSHTFPRYCAEGGRLCEPEGGPTGRPAPQRYDMVESDVLLFYPTIGLAWQPLPGLSIGGNFQAAYGSFDLSLVVGSITNKEDPALDADIKLKTRDWFTPTGILGVHWKALSFLELGASVRFGFTMKFEGEVEATLPETLSMVTVDPNPGTIRLDVPLPWVVRSGVRYVNRDALERERFDLELDFVWESTGQVGVFDVATDMAFEFGGTRQEIESLSQQHNWNDSWSLRLGGSYNLHDLFQGGTLTLRAGGFYESAAAPEQFSRLDFLPFARVGVTAGVGVEWGRYSFGVGYAYIFHEDRNVAPDGGDARTGECQASGGASGCGSGVTQVIPIAPDDGRPVANGAFDVSIQILTLGAAASFGG